jgi:adenine-specific DNA-methyltransferase
MNRILQGNSVTDLAPLVVETGKPIKAIVTDPPYGVNYRSRHAETPEGLRWVKDVANDLDLEGALGLFQDVMDELMPLCDDEAELYVFTRWDIVGDWINAVRALDRHGFKYKMMLIWDKMEPGTGDIDSNWGCGHELILYAKRGLRRAPWRRSGVLHFAKVRPNKIIHPTEKPVGLMEKLVEFSTDVGDLVVDPFSGSGSASVAAQRLNRQSLAMDLDSDHVKNSNARIANDTLFGL